MKLNEFYRKYIFQLKKKLLNLNENNKILIFGIFYLGDSLHIS